MAIDELEKAIAILTERVSKAAANGSLANFPELAGMLYGWHNLAGDEVPKYWEEAFTKDGDNLPFLLLELQGLSVSDRVYRPLQISTINRFLDAVEVEFHLKRIEQSELSPKQKEQLASVQEAISMGKQARY